MGKHPETANHLGLHIGILLSITGKLSNSHEIREWIDGFN